jgi:DNA ligase (NAD+)
LEALETARGLALDRWLFATGIPNVGVTVAEQIASAHTCYSELMDSPILKAVVRMNELYDKATSVNPRSTLQRPKDEDEREARQMQFNYICGEIGVLGDQLSAAGLATRKTGTTLPPDFICVIKVEAAKAVLAFFASDYGKKWMARLAELGIDAKAPEKHAPTTDAPLSGITFVLTGTLSKPRGEIAEQIKAAGGIMQDTVSKNTRYLVAGADAGQSKTTKARSLGTEVINEEQLLELLSAFPSSVPLPEKRVEIQPLKDLGKIPVAPRRTVVKKTTSLYDQEELF